MHDRARLPALAILPLLLTAAYGPPRMEARFELSPWAFVDAIEAAAPGGTALLEDFSFAHDAGRFSFPTGQLTLIEVEGTPVGAVIEGSGRFDMTAPDPVEAWQLDRVLGSPQAAIELQGVMLLFGEDTWAGLSEGLVFGEPAPGSEFRNLVRDGVKFLRGNGSVDPHVIRALVNGEDGRFLHAHLEPRRGDPMLFRFFGPDTEEVSLGRKADGRGDRFEVVSAFHRVEDYPDPDPREDPVWGAQVLQYQIESWITRGPDFRAHARAHMIADLEGGTWVPFHLSGDLEIDSLRWGDGSPVEFERRNRNDPQFWVRLPENPVVVELNAWYHGKTLEYRDLWYWFDNPTGWYPSTGRTEASFDMTFHTDERYEFLGSGTRVSESTANGVVTSHWMIERPESQASFNLGEFQEYNREFPGLPPLRLQVNDEFHRQLQAVQSQVILQEKGAAEAVAMDLYASLAFFQEVFGPLDVTEFNASEIPYNHGQAFPGLIHLSYATFLQSGAHDEGQNESFRAHEVAHQWWGFSVEPRSYRDQWLSEGLAEFSGLWYMQVARLAPQTYFDALEESRDRILDRRGRAGPISLGTRVVVGGRAEDYGLTIYDKGAWVIHMLRNLFMDMQTMDESAFEALMRDVATRFKNQRISTAQFQAVVEEHLGGADMQWFFDQWVHGSAIPTWRWAWRGEEVADGYRLTLRVRQSGVPDDFRAIVPVTVGFGAEGAATMKVLIEGPETVVELPLLPREPVEIVFNDFMSVLADVDDENW